MTEKEFMTLYKDTKNKLIEMNVPIQDINSCKLDNKKNALGTCQALDFDYSRFDLSFSSRLLALDKEICINTICHELIHTIDGCYNHGRLFKKYGKIISKQLNISEIRTYVDSRIVHRKEKYNFICKDCGATYSYQRLTKGCKSLIEKKHEYRCNYCDSYNIEQY